MRCVCWLVYVSAICLCFTFLKQNGVSRYSCQKRGSEVVAVVTKIKFCPLRCPSPSWFKIRFLFKWILNQNTAPQILNLSTLTPIKGSIFTEFKIKQDLLVPVSGYQRRSSKPKDLLTLSSRNTTTHRDCPLNLLQCRVPQMILWIVYFNLPRCFVGPVAGASQSRPRDIEIAMVLQDASQLHGGSVPSSLQVGSPSLRQTAVNVSTRCIVCRLRGLPEPTALFSASPNRVEARQHWLVVVSLLYQCVPTHL